MIIIISILVIIIIVLAIAANRRIKLNYKTASENAQIAKDNIKLEQEKQELEKNISSSEINIQSLEKRKKELSADINQISAQAKAASDQIYQQSYNLMQEHLDQAAQDSSKKYKEAEEEAKKEYALTLIDSKKELSKIIDEIQNKQNELSQLQSKAQAAIASAKKQQLEEDQKHFYTINITEDALWDIAKLKEACQELRGDTTPVNKIIWEIYYKQPTLELLNRLFPNKEAQIGIYKITNLKTEQCYIGQSVNLRSRLLDHIKAGLGINSSNNKFYTELKKLGPENFMYEILEICNKEELNEREKYWIQFYQSTNYGYNTTKGGS